MSDVATPPHTQTRTTRTSSSSPAKKTNENGDAGEENATGSTRSRAPPAPIKAETVVKKESFKWSTPADEFADDVASDAEEEEGEDLLC